MSQHENKQNTLALIIGFGLIIFIAVFTIFKPFSHTKQNDSQGDSFLQSESSSSSVQLSSEDLMNKIRTKTPLKIIDVRSASEFQEEHILDSQNIPAENFSANLESLDTNKTYVIVDDGRADIASAITTKLVQNKFKQTYYLTGGFLDWKSNLNPTISAGDPNSFTDQAKVSYLNSEQLNELINSENGLFIIDVRKNDAFSEDHLQGAVNIFLDDLEKRQSEIPIGKKIILYDSDGLWAFQGAVRLFDMNILNVYALSDGFNGWIQKGFAAIK